ncbi:MAG: prepilin peptidase [candidate division Zixibacteria bacterium]|nr:prepilin peptidase [candidate division Zixibacteria bacterium]
MPENANYFGTMAFMAAIIVAALAVYTDLRWRKIPNNLTVPAVAAGIILNILSGGWNGLLFSLTGLVIGIVVFIVPFALRGMGGGDVKLMGALGALLGGYAIVSIAIYTAILGGVLAIVVAVYNHQMGSSLRKVMMLLAKLVPFVGRSKEIDKTTSLRLPYGLAIGGGTMLLILIGQVF